MLTLVSTASGCGGYYYYDEPTEVYPSKPPGHGHSPVPGKDDGTSSGGRPGPTTPPTPPPTPPPTTPARGGFVVVTGDDADDLWHCEGALCGGLYPALFKDALKRSRSGGKGILAIGVNDRQALIAFNSWNDPAQGGPGAQVTHARSTEDISRVDFTQYAFVYLPSAGEHTLGGLSVRQIATLNERQTDLARFVNEKGGSLLALTQAGVEGGWGFLPVPLTTVDTSFDIAEPTAALQAFVPTLTAVDLSHKSFHNVFTGPSGYSGLQVLAVNDEAYHPHVGQPVMLGGTSVVLSAEDCADGEDNDGDGQVDWDDTDCHVCGNGHVDPGEACDDGNTVSGDGCSATCTQENRAPVATCQDVSVCTDPGVCVATSPSGMATAVDPDGDSLSWDAHPVGPYAPGTHGVCVTASDGRKQDSCWSNVTVRDCEAPALTCPASFQVECTSEGVALVQPPEATARDNCGAAPVAPPKAGVLPVGTHTLTYSATDTSGNTATCSTQAVVVDTKAPAVSCPESILAECTGRNSAWVTPGAAKGSDTCSPVKVSGPAADFYPLGTNTVSYTARDASGNASTCTSTIQVVDVTPPAVTLTPPAPLWPVSGDYHTVRLEDCITVYDRCSGGLTQTGASASISCVASDEAQGAGAPDIVFLDATTVKVKVDRAAAGNGRVYSLHFEVRDAAGNRTRGICPVGVPVERGAPATDSGEQWRTCLGADDATRAWKPVRSRGP
ncbi:HYR domain-containing protein [Melittangium boletus]|uniref:HYR domain-containing protein n=1 Tax=Melittangium boletus TaxID=83453 RepID=UPI003DA2F2BB